MPATGKNPFLLLTAAQQESAQRTIQWLVQHADLRVDVDDKRVADLMVSTATPPVSQWGFASTDGVFLKNDGEYLYFFATYRDNPKPEDNGLAAVRILRDPVLREAKTKKHVPSSVIAAVLYMLGFDGIAMLKSIKPVSFLNPNAN